MSRTNVHIGAWFRYELTMATGDHRFPASLMYTAARLYYLEEATQAEVAQQLGTSRATVSRLLSEARRAGIARIEVVAPVDGALDDLARRVESELGLDRVHLTASPTRGPVGEALAPALSLALQAVGLRPGEVLLVSSGRTVYEAAQAALPALPGVEVVPTIGGQDEPEAWYATNEITRQVAERIGGKPTFLYAPALPSAQLHTGLLEDPGFRRVVEQWECARCAIMGVGAPPATRSSLPRFVPREAGTLLEAVGDVCSRFYDAAGAPVPFPGSDRLIATALDVVRGIPTVIAVAAGAEKVPSIRAGARAGYLTQLVTDADTARELA
jgi:DNA-binding transcriptional regulator LsrR (DeoR family)